MLQRCLLLYAVTGGWSEWFRNLIGEKPLLCLKRFIFCWFSSLNNLSEVSEKCQWHGMDPVWEPVTGSAQLCCKAALTVTASLWLIWTGPNSHESQTQALFTALLFPSWSNILECGASANIIAIWWSREGARSSKWGNKRKRKMERTKINTVCESLQFDGLCSLGSWCSCWLVLRASGLFPKELGSPNATDSVSSNPTLHLWSTASRQRLRSLDTFRG